MNSANSSEALVLGREPLEGVKAVEVGLAGQPPGFPGVSAQPRLSLGDRVITPILAGNCSPKIGIETPLFA